MIFNQNTWKLIGNWRISINGTAEEYSKKLIKLSTSHTKYIYMGYSNKMDNIAKFHM